MDHPSFRPPPDSRAERLLVRMTWGLVAVGAFVVVLLALAIGVVGELEPGERGRATLWVWIAFFVTTALSFPVGWQHRAGEKRTEENPKSRATQWGAGVAVLVSSIFLTLPADARSALLGAGAGFFAGLGVGVACGVLPRWIQKWRGQLK